MFMEFVKNSMSSITNKRNMNSKKLAFTKVILVCVHDIDSNIIINHNHLYSMFSPYGNIQRILIFDRTNTFKAFIEYDSVQSSIMARKHMNRALIFDGRYRMSIYPSNLQQITFQNNFPGGVDYTMNMQPYAYTNTAELHRQVGYQQPPLMSPERYYSDSYPEFSISPGVRPSLLLEGGSSKSSPRRYSDGNSQSFEEDDRRCDEEIMQMVNQHHFEAKKADNEGWENIYDYDDNEKFNTLVQSAFSNNNSYDVFKRESFNSTHSGDQDKAGFDEPAYASSYGRRNSRLPCFPFSYTELPSSHPTQPLMTVYPEATIHKMYSMDDIHSEHEAVVEKRQPVQCSAEFDKIYFENVLSSNSSVSTQNPEKSQENIQRLGNQNCTDAEQDVNGEKKSLVLHVLGIENKEVNAKMLFNIFSNFGNIVKLIFIKTRAVALVEFDKISSAALAKEGLNNVSFMGKPLRITFSKYRNIQLQPGQEEKYKDQLIIGEEKSFRFKDGKNIVIAHPSTTLHVSNLSKDVCNDKKAISNCFHAYGEVKAVKPMFGDNGKNMCLVKMKSPEECLKAMAYLHDTEFGGRRLQVSFSRSKAC
jgi:RNA recognition motif-containing protein